jgi:hypothetical protein
VVRQPPPGRLSIVSAHTCAQRMAPYRGVILRPVRNYIGRDHDGVMIMGAAVRPGVQTARRESRRSLLRLASTYHPPAHSNFPAIRGSVRAHHGILQMPGHRLSDRRCGARTRKGTSCQRRSYPNGRCRNHGGLCTGPKTTAGRSRIAAAQQLRWKLWRLQHRDSA